MVWDRICDLTLRDRPFLYCADDKSVLAYSILFFLVLLAHITQALVYRAKYCWVICMAVLWELLGFVLRAYATVDQTVSKTFIPSTLLILLAPLLLNAFVYMIFGRMVFYYLREQKIAGIRAQRLATWFVCLDIVSFIIQLIGGVLSLTAEHKKLGRNIYMAGIGLQQFFILVFIGLLVLFHAKMNRGEGLQERGTKWKTLVFAMYAALTFITIRVIYRLVEFSGSHPTGPINREEKYFYILEASPMLFAFVIWNIVHPGSIFSGPESAFSNTKERQEQTEMKLLDGTGPV